MKAKPKGRKRLFLRLAALVILLLIAYIVWVLQFSYPGLKPKDILPSFTATTQPTNLPWPGYGESAIGVKGYGVVATNGTQTPLAMASTAKLITALCVLKKDPISNPASSPIITLSQADVNVYTNYLLEEGSVVRVVAGEKISEYQMLEAMLLPSANNIADSIAIWAFGSLANYTAYANSYVKSMGWNNTTIGVDASGFDPSSTTTATNLIGIGQSVAANTLLNQIVGQTEVPGIPVVGTIKNVNSLIGTDGIIGIKTGNTTQDSGVYLSESNVNVGGTTFNITTAVMGAPSLWQAMDSSLKIIVAAQDNFSVPLKVTGINRGTVIGQYSVPWSSTDVNAIAASSLPLVVWKGNFVAVSVDLKNASEKTPKNTVVGSITASDNRSGQKISTNILLAGSISRPSKWWLIIHPNVSLQF